MAIFVSTAGIKEKKIVDSIRSLVNNGFRDIELSGGTDYYEGWLDDVTKIKQANKLNYLCHNYFPPPKDHLVLNMSSSDDNIYSNTVDFYLNSLETCSLLGSTKYSIHAGFLVDLSLQEIGGKINNKKTMKRSVALKKFCEGYGTLKKKALSLGVDLYIENNVYSKDNYSVYGVDNPFLMATYDEYLELRDKIDFKLLLDLGHLKVTSSTLSLDYKKQLSQMLNASRYIHVSDNDSLEDSNGSIKSDSDLVKLLKDFNLADKTITLEISDSIDSIKRSFNIMEDILKMGKCL